MWWRLIIGFFGLWILSGGINYSISDDSISLGDPRNEKGEIQERSVPLEGHSFVVWTGPDETPVKDAIKEIRKQVEAIYVWDADNKEWLSFHRDVPARVNSLTHFKFGAGVWIVVSQPVTWKQPAPK